MKVKGLLKDLGGLPRVISLRDKGIKNARPKDDFSNRFNENARLYKRDFRLLRLFSVHEAYIELTLDEPLIIRPGDCLSIKIGNVREVLPIVSFEEGRIKAAIYRHIDKNSLNVGTLYDVYLPFPSLRWTKHRDKRKIILVGEGEGVAYLQSVSKLSEQGPEVHAVRLGEKTPYDETLLGFLEERLIFDIEATYFLFASKKTAQETKDSLKENGIKDKDIHAYTPPHLLGSAYPKEKIGERHAIKVHFGEEVFDLPSIGGDSVLTSIEKAGIDLKSACKNGTCGMCRMKLIKGEVHIEEETRHHSDKELGYIHGCVSYPLGDVEVRVY